VLLCIGARLHSADVSGWGGLLIAIDLSWLIGSCIGAAVFW